MWFQHAVIVQPHVDAVERKKGAELALASQGPANQ
jgi:hypothetical protein